MVTTDPVRLSVIVGSTREGRVGDRVAEWFAVRARRRVDLRLTVLDLAAYEFPARYPAAPTPAVATFVAEVAGAEAFVVVTPEYNRSFPASLKQAIDYAYDEWRAKPVGFVSYGHHSDGRYAIDHLRAVFTELHVVTVRDEVRFDLARTGGGFDGDASDHSVTTLLDELVWWGLALRDARGVRPYVR